MSADDFEREYLGTGTVIHREKVAYKAAFWIVGGLAAATAMLSGAGFVAAFAGEPQALAGGVLFLAVSGVLALASVVGSVLRTVVTDRELVLHAGIRQEARIPLAGITKVWLSRYDAEIRRRIVAEGRRAFAAIHPREPSVVVEWVDAAGAAHVSLVASDAPEVLADVLRRASAAARAGKGERRQAPAIRARVESSVAEAADDTASDPHSAEAGDEATAEAGAEAAPTERARRGGE